MSQNRIVAAIAALALTACGRDGVASDMAELLSSLQREQPEIVVMSRNLYLGANLDPAFGATTLPDALAGAVKIWSDVQASNPPARMQAIADEIAKARPDVVGLQEAALWRKQDPGDLVGGNADVVVYDLLQSLLEALEERGLRYEVATLVENADAELPVLPLGIDVRLTQRDAILVRAGLPYSEPVTANYRAAGAFDLPPVHVDVLRGWGSVVVEHEQGAFRFVSTHLELGELAGGLLQEAQASELFDFVIGEEPRPTIVVGDLNSRADGSTTRSYAMGLGAGFTDVWGALRPGTDGFTCCQADDLRNVPSAAYERIDHVMVRGGLAGRKVEHVGATPAARTAEGLWPSDHAGVVAWLRLAR